MSIPKYTELRVAVLDYLKLNGAAGVKQMVQPLADRFGLTEEEVNRMYDSGKGKIFRDRISWAVSYLGFTDLIFREQRGVYGITEKGISMLNTPEKIDEYVDLCVEQREKDKKQSKGTEEEFKKAESSPIEILFQSYENIKKSVLDEILETVISKSSLAFENLVVELLQKMGYGGEVKDAGLVTKASNDGGIDGIIKEDVLGLGRIHIQAKKYGKENGVGREEIQKFVGALAVAKSNKGVFITTSYYTKGAIDYAASLNGATNIVLINGEELAEHIYNFNLGMQTEQVITIKKLDGEFWDEMGE